jgi:hypothetical protein
MSDMRLPTSTIETLLDVLASRSVVASKPPLGLDAYAEQTHRDSVSQAIGTHCSVTVTVIPQCGAAVQAM